ncbi:hypothetical protein HMPREF0262_00837 [Clostridium sp. ATCC 29733]|nr:hypothetical protein HMPREF0262_00837 [Clostridium sp. ATCC 29733]
MNTQIGIWIAAGIAAGISIPEKIFTDTGKYNMEKRAKMQMLKRDL